MRRRVSAWVGGSVILALVLACHGTRVRAPDPTGQPRVRAGGACPPSGIHAAGKCPEIVVPHVNASSPDGCESDANCGGYDARCVENPGYRPERSESGARAMLRSNLLGDAPRPPGKTICVSDECRTDADCGKAGGCLCGSGEGMDRNHCIRVDACEKDADCPQGSRCECDHDGANYCYPANCDSDAECNGFTCTESPTGGRYCRTAKDRCKVSADCPPVTDFQVMCGYDVGEGVWGCRNVPYPPPG